MERKCFPCFAIFALALGAGRLGAEDFHDWAAIQSGIHKLELTAGSYSAALENVDALMVLQALVAGIDALDDQVEDLEKYFPGTESSLRIFARGGYRWPSFRGMIQGVLDLFLDQLLALKTHFESLEAESANPRPRFRRGDLNGDGEADLTDAVELLKYKFLGGASPACAKAADVDDSGEVDQTDAIRLLLFLFSGGPGPEAPRSCGADDTPDRLSCASPGACPARSSS